MIGSVSHKRFQGIHIQQRQVEYPADRYVCYNATGLDLGLTHDSRPLYASPRAQSIGIPTRLAFQMLSVWTTSPWIGILPKSLLSEALLPHVATINGSQPRLSHPLPLALLSPDRHMRLTQHYSSLSEEILFSVFNDHDTPHTSVASYLSALHAVCLVTHSADFIEQVLRDYVLMIVEQALEEGHTPLIITYGDVGIPRHIAEQVCHLWINPAYKTTISIQELDTDGTQWQVITPVNQYLCVQHQSPAATSDEASTYTNVRYMLEECLFRLGRTL